MDRPHEADRRKAAKALTDVLDAVGALDEPTARMVLHWALQSYGPAAATARAVPEADLSAARDAQLETTTAADLMTRTGARTEAERALVMAYWFKQAKAQREFDALSLNSELKHLGHRLNHVTHTLDALMSTKPQLIVQTRKQGSTQQARKLYAITEAGVERVNAMLTSERDS